MIRSLRTARWRKNDVGLNARDKTDDGNARKISIDHTVLSSADSSGLNTSHHFSRSFDVDGPVEVYPSNYAQGGELGDAATNFTLGVRASQSEPTFLTHQADSSQSDFAPQPRYYANPQPVIAPIPNPQQPCSPKSNDPALQARIEAIMIQQQLLGDNHPDVLFALSSLAKLHQRRGNFTEAASILREVKIRGMQAQISPQFSSTRKQDPQDSHSVPTEISFRN